jgi:DNA-binding GntR family transcriptional regulator
LATQSTLKATAIYQSLREQILSGHIKSGVRLLLRELAQEHQTSELPVREALRMLERDGLVEILPHRGARVAVITLAEVEEAFFIRSHLEALATETAVEHVTPAHLEKLDRCIGALQSALEEGDGITFGELNKQFHQMIYGICPYRRLEGLINGLWDGQTKFQTVFTINPARMPESQAEHRAIVERIRARDKEGAARLMLEHKLRAGETLIRALKDFGKERVA